MFKKENEQEATQALAWGGEAAVAGEHGRSPIEEWTEDTQVQGKKKLFSFGTKKEKDPFADLEEKPSKNPFKLGKNKPMKEKKEKVPLTKEQKKKRRKRIIIGVVVVALLAVFVLPKFFAPEVLPSVTVTEANVGSVEQTIEGSGAVKSEEIKTYFSPVSATVENFALNVGDTVEAGDMLLTYNEAELEELYKQADLTGTAANYGYQDAITRDNKNISEFNRSSAALNTINQQLDAEKDENKHVQSRISEYSQMQAESSAELEKRWAVLTEKDAAVKSAQAELDAAKEALKVATDNLNKAEEEAAKAQSTDTAATVEGATADPGTQAAPTTDLQALKAAVDTATANVAAAEKKLADAQAAYAAAQESVDEEQNYLNEIKGKLEGYNDRLADSTENLQELQSDKAKEEGIKDSSEASKLTNAARQELATNNNLSDLNAQMTKDDINEGKAGIQAEFSGVVTEVTAVTGGPAAKGGSLFTIASNENVVVDMSVTRYDLEKLEVGQTAEISLAGHTYTGTVSKLSRLAEANTKGTPVVSAEIHIDNPDENIYLGLEAKVTVSGHKVENVLVVPAEAVNTGQEGTFCYVVEEGVVVKKPVETGLSSVMYVEILSGLNTGDKVITNGIEFVEEGMQVTAVEG